MAEGFGMKTKLLALILALVALLPVSRAGALPITYSLDIPLPTGAPNPSASGEVTGTITTNGTIGQLSIYRISHPRI
jgi:hypothetical protein